ncbi:MAG TPA: ADOP family duplicated permease [Bryobacteraceae bacterium]|nr:ADOP family duplicated permease [Bryobacteraceae bacterium]
MSFPMLWNDLLVDVRIASRGLAKAPLFAAVAFAVLALALGANASIFNLLNTVLLRPIYAGQPETLAAVSTISADGRPSGFSYRAYEEIRRNQGVFSSMFAWFARGIYSIEANGSLAPGSVVLVTPAYYDVLRVRPLMGRTFREGDEAVRTAVISYRCWRTRFGGLPDIIGKSFRVEGHPYTVMGVMPEQFRGYSIGLPEDITIALPAWFEAEQVRESARPFMEIGGRLKDDASLALAGQELGTLWPAVRAGVMPSDLTPAQRKDFLAQRLSVTEGRAGSATDYVRRRYRRPLFILMGAVGITLLIACANLSGLLVSRAAARRQDTAIRLAMGAGRWRLLRQSFVEALLLALPAVAAGAAVGVWISRGLADFMWTSLLPHELNLTPDWRVYGWLAALAILIAIAASAAPVWQVSHRAGASLITGVTRGRAGVTHGVGKWLVSAQSALALVLLTAAALFGASFRNLKASAQGFEVETVLAMQLTNRPGNTMTDAERPEYYRQLLPEISRVPGVRAVTLTRTSPIIPWQHDVREPVTASGGAAEAGAYRHDVTPGFFETFGIRLVRGRAMAFTDTEHTPRVAVVSMSLAALLFPSGDAVGRRISVGTAREGQNVQIAGIAEDASLWNIRRRRPPQIYLSYLQQPERMASPLLEIRTSGPPEAVAKDVTRVLDRFGREYPMRTMPIRELVDMTLAQDRLMAMLSVFFGIFPVVLAAVGLYGLVAFNVSRRTAEIGVRMALGAGRARLMCMVVKEALALVAFGVVIGVPLALACARMARGMLYEVSPADPLLLGAACMVLFTAGGLAALAPAFRAMRVQPIQALRSE